MKPMIFLTLATALFAVDSKDIPANRLVDWKPANITFPDASWDTVDVSTFGIKPGNAISDGISAKFREALTAKGSVKRVFKFPEGTFTFESPILIGPSGDKWGAVGVNANDFVILGAGPEKTKFKFQCDVEYFKGLIWIENPSGYSVRNSPRELTATPKTGDDTLAIQYNWDIKVGDFIDVKSDNDSAVMFPKADTSRAWWKKYADGSYDVEFGESFGQIVKVTEVLAGNKVKIEPKLALDYKPELTPRASVYVATKSNRNIGIEGIYIEHVIDSSAYVPGGANDIFDIAIRFASDIYVKNVESFNTARGHVIVEYSHNVAITDSKFSYARNYGVGGAGYGVCIQNRSSRIAVENNEFKHLRHAIVLKEGANHCVIGYNWSHDWAMLDPLVGVEAEADLSVHGMYSHSNLFEGNICHNIWYADYWGPTGPKTTAFRNRVYGDTLKNGIAVDDFSHKSNVIGNIIPGKAVWQTDSTSDDLFVEGNVIGGTAVWNTLTSSSILPSSLYLESKPVWWNDSCQWPTFGPEISASETNQIPASFVSGAVLVIPSIHKSAVQKIGLIQQGNVVSINGISSGKTIKLYSLNGRELSRIVSTGSITQLTIPTNGVFVVKAGNWSGKIVIK